MEAFMPQLLMVRNVQSETMLCSQVLLRTMCMRIFFPSQFSASGKTGLQG